MVTQLVTPRDRWPSRPADQGADRGGAAVLRGQRPGARRAGG